MLQFNTAASLTGATARFTCIITFFLFIGLSVVHATFNFEVSQLVNNNNAYSDQGVLMEWSGSFNLNGHSYTSFGSGNFLNSPASANNNPNSIVLASVVEPYNTFGFEVFHDENGNPGGTVSIEINAPVPEPSTYALILGCFTFLSLILRKHFA